MDTRKYAPIEVMRDRAALARSETGRSYFDGVVPFFAKSAGNETNRGEIEIRWRDYEAEHFRGMAVLFDIYEKAEFGEQARLDAVIEIVSDHSTQPLMTPE